MDAPTHKRDVGMRLLMAIQVQGLTPAGLCRRMRVSPHKLGNWLRGKHYPEPLFLYKFAERHNVSLDWIMTGRAVVSANQMDDVLLAVDRVAAQARQAAERRAIERGESSQASISSPEQR